jgi:hypothetical protein
METKRRINEMVTRCPISINGVNINADLNIMLLGSYDILLFLSLYLRLKSTVSRHPKVGERWVRG